MGIATTSTTQAIRQLSDQNSQGTALGASTTDKIGFFTNSTSGTSAQSTCVGSVTLAGATSSNANGSSLSFSSLTVMNAILAAIGDGLANQSGMDVGASQGLMGSRLSAIAMAKKQQEQQAHRRSPPALRGLRFLPFGKALQAWRVE